MLEKLIGYPISPSQKNKWQTECGQNNVRDQQGEINGAYPSGTAKFGLWCREMIDDIAQQKNQRANHRSINRPFVQRHIPPFNRIQCQYQQQRREQIEH